MITAIVQLNFFLDQSDRSFSEIKDMVNDIMRDGVNQSGQGDKISWVVEEVSRRFQ